MARKIRQPPAVSESNDPRAREYFDKDVFDTLTMVGTVTVDVGSIAAGGIATFTISVPGAKIGKQHQVILAPPSTIDAGLLWCGGVSADSVVTVRLYNSTGSAINPVSATWGVRVMP